MWRQSETNLDEGGELTKRCQKNRLETKRYPALCPRDGPFRSARAFGMETDVRNGLGGGNCWYTGSRREPKMEIPAQCYLPARRDRRDRRRYPAYGNHSHPCATRLLFSMRNHTSRTANAS